jgi:hypothetical protein
MDNKKENVNTSKQSSWHVNTMGNFTVVMNERKDFVYDKGFVYDHEINDIIAQIIDDRCYYLAEEKDLLIFFKRLPRFLSQLPKRLWKFLPIKEFNVYMGVDIENKQEN